MVIVAHVIISIYISSSIRETELATPVKMKFKVRMEGVDVIKRDKLYSCLSWMVARGRGNQENIRERKLTSINCNYSSNDIIALSCYIFSTQKNYAANYYNI